MFEEEVTEQSDFEQPVRIDEAKPEETFEGEAEEEEIFEREEKVEDTFAAVSEKETEEAKVDLSAHPTQFDESDSIEAEKKGLYHDSQPVAHQEAIKEESQPVVERIVSQEMESKEIRLSDEDVKRIAEEVVNKLSDRIIREIAWEVIPQLAEDIILRRIKELEKEIE